jgi:hypothetical protein
MTGGRENKSGAEVENRGRSEFLKGMKTRLQER